MPRDPQLCRPVQHVLLWQVFPAGSGRRRRGRVDLHQQHQRLLGGQDGLHLLAHLPVDNVVCEETLDSLVGVGTTQEKLAKVRPNL